MRYLAYREITLMSLARLYTQWRLFWSSSLFLAPSYSPSSLGRTFATRFLKKLHQSNYFVIWLRKKK